VERTVSDVFAARPGRRAGGRRTPTLVVAFNASDPQMGASRHLLREIDVVCFGRGPRAAVRDVHDGLRRLVIRVPDKVMSLEHGQLARGEEQWRLEDPRSKNGARLSGRATRCAVVRAGETFSLGHTLFTLDELTTTDDTPLDLEAARLAPPRPELATLYPELATAIAAMARVAPSPVAVLLAGETGTGKEVYARALHALSGRAGPFVAVNCGALPTTLVEAELFGHRRGAFSGAVADRPGHVRTADRGTLFLDEIGELPAAAQVTLLRVLQEHEVVPVGDSVPVKVDVRICAATHRDLAALVAAGTFREDLHARLLGLTVALPPLRARRFDLGLLLPSLLQRLGGGGATPTMSPAAAHALFAHDWPHNVRELERTLATAIALASDGRIDVEHLPPALQPLADPATEAAPAVSAPPTLDENDDALRARLTALLAAHDGNVAAVARELDKHREQVHRWVRRFGIDIESFRR
jgi:transcriptional regulator with GAF, ATPase, and Fis domain